MKVLPALETSSSRVFVAQISVETFGGATREEYLPGVSYLGNFANYIKKSKPSRHQ